MAQVDDKKFISLVKLTGMQNFSTKILLTFD